MNLSQPISRALSRSLSARLGGRGTSKTVTGSDLLPAPTFSQPSGVTKYDPVNLSVYGPEGVDLFYAIGLGSPPSPPTDSGSLYSGPITLEYPSYHVGDVYIQVQGWAGGVPVTEIGYWSAIMAIDSAATPTWDVTPPGFYAIEWGSALSVPLSGITGITYYTINGTDPTDSDSIYGVPIVLSFNVIDGDSVVRTIVAINYEPGRPPSSILSGDFTMAVRYYAPTESILSPVSAYADLDNTVIHLGGVIEYSTSYNGISLTIDYYDSEGNVYTTDITVDGFGSIDLGMAISAFSPSTANMPLADVAAFVVTAYLSNPAPPPYPSDTMTVNGTVSN